MESMVRVTEYKVEGKILYLKVQGFLKNAGPGEKVRVRAVFKDGTKDRLFPLETETVGFLEQGAAFMGSAQISLPHVFYPFDSRESADKIRVSFTAAGVRERTTLEGKEFSLERTLFENERKKHSFWFDCYRVLSSVICIALLPMFVIDGMFAVKGYKALDVGENPAAGLKAVFLHANALTKRISGFTYSVREWKTRYLRRCYHKYKKQPVRKREILFLSERPLEKQGNLSLIKERLAETGEFEITEFICSRPVNKLTFSELKQSAKKMAGAQMIILEDFYPQLHALDIRKETKVVQLWHACGAFKTFGFSRLGKPGGPKQDSKNHRCYDMTFVSSDPTALVYSEAFGIPSDHVKALGVPRTDILFESGYREQVVERLRKKYSWLYGKRVVLFAPTFRGAGNKTAYYPVERLDLNQFMETLPEDCVLIVKQHPFVKNQFSYDKKWEGRIFDLTGRENINDLLFLTAVLVTDYSSSVFEAALLSVPMVFYVFDKEEYLKDRDVYYDFDQFAPGELAVTQKAMEEAVGRALEHREKTELQKAKEAWFKEEFLSALDGRSTEKITNFVIKSIKNFKGMDI